VQEIDVGFALFKQLLPMRALWVSNDGASVKGKNNSNKVLAEFKMSRVSI
jgi:hypothetical protein